MTGGGAIHDSRIQRQLLVAVREKTSTMKLHMTIPAVIFLAPAIPAFSQRTPDPTGAPASTTVFELATDGPHLFATCDGHGGFMNTDDGSTWFPGNSNLQDAEHVRPLKLLLLK